MIISVILAAGEGSRMKSKLPKAVHKVCGKSIINYMMSTCINGGSDKSVIIVGHNKEEVLKEIEKHGQNKVEAIEQPIGENVPYGTGYAVMQAKEYIGDDDTVITLCGDTPLVTDTTIKKIIEYHDREKNEVTILTADINNPKGYGRIIRDELNSTVSEIVEEKDADEMQKAKKEVNSGIYCFSGKRLKEALKKLTNDNSQNEYYLTDTIKILKQDGYKVGACKLDDNNEILGINSRVQLAEVQQIMQKRINDEIMLSGVTIINPNSTYIEYGVEIGRDTIIYPNTYIEGSTIIGKDCVIGPNSRIIDSTIGNDVKVEQSTIVESKIGDNTTIGPYAYLRPNSNIGNNVKIGDFVEVKNSTIGNNTKASHLAYIGDANVGDKVNIGCGVVFVNYDGVNKHQTTVEDNVFVGSNCNLVAPVTIKENALLAAGSTITDDVQANALSIARARQINKDNWVKNKK
ncbi:bifunctional UDP-N-acetylglucosamine diphosphorylase/glucosamine-1-phosphate N-acetyltransferase GlmU [Clostridiaceae bacterium M8S5]|nr:bifunctional UDP-N-acetylglucosamine diphosphorylase/glucosamine-1-phosphate N-acetyltransferase GlmU [Clostridiaceae bacterium M8S5]